MPPVEYEDRASDRPRDQKTKPWMPMGIICIVCLGALAVSKTKVILSRTQISRAFWIKPLSGGSAGTLSSRLDHRNFTIVSAYFNLGTLRKGSRATVRPGIYRKWAVSLTRLHNPLVFYTDDPDFKTLVEEGRRHLHNTTAVILVNNKTALWSFTLIKQIQNIFDDSRYPKYYPGTVSAEYCCVQHAKYDLVKDAIDRKLYAADYYAWLDLGYFRTITTAKFQFRLEVPPDFKNSHIAYTQINNPRTDLTFKAVILRNKLWVGGGMFIGTANKLVKLVKQYQAAVTLSLRLGVMNVDQQIIYAMFTEDGQNLTKPDVSLQVYRPPKAHNPWFYLGFLCLKDIKVTEDSRNTTPNIDRART